MKLLRKGIAIIGLALLLLAQGSLLVYSAEPGDNGDFPPGIVVPVKNPGTCATGTSNYMVGFNLGCGQGLGDGDMDKRNGKGYSLPAICNITTKYVSDNKVGGYTTSWFGFDSIAIGQFTNGWNNGCKRGYDTGFNRDPNAPPTGVVGTGGNSPALIVPFPGVETNAPTSSAAAGAFLANYINSVYKYSIGIAALFAMAQIVIGAVEYVGSPGGISSQEDAKGRIKGAIFGLILLIGATTILATLNPRLLNLTPGESQQTLKIIGENKTLAEKNAIAAAEQKVADKEYLRQTFSDQVTRLEDAYEEAIADGSTATAEEKAEILRNLKDAETQLSNAVGNLNKAQAELDALKAK